MTGASRGIGFAIAERLIAEGANVVITARNPDGLQAAQGALPGAAVRIVAGKADDPDHQQKLRSHTNRDIDLEKNQNTHTHTHIYTSFNKYPTK